MTAGNVVRVRTASGKLVSYGALHRDTEDWVVDGSGTPVRLRHERGAGRATTRV